jgi:hypothetical protein
VEGKDAKIVMEERKHTCRILRDRRPARSFNGLLVGTECCLSYTIGSKIVRSLWAELRQGTGLDIDAAFEIAIRARHLQKKYSLSAEWHYVRHHGHVGG